MPHGTSLQAYSESSSVVLLGSLNHSAGIRNTCLNTPIFFQPPDADMGRYARPWSFEHKSQLPFLREYRQQFDPHRSMGPIGTRSDSMRLHGASAKKQTDYFCSRGVGCLFCFYLLLQSTASIEIEWDVHTGICWNQESITVGSISGG
jgi:hypothetical protein